MQETSFEKVQTSWQEKWINHRFQTVVILCFLVWTPLLVIETLQIQHSCHPLVWFGEKLAEECQQASISSPPSPVNLDAGTVGIIVGAIAGITGAPIAVAVGIGLLAWLAIKSLF
jgi:hypothetical protein